MTLTEQQFMDQVTALAEIRGWAWVHFRPARTENGWRTPVSGPLGKGWPDLFLARSHGAERRIILAELKRVGGTPSPEQNMVLTFLRRFVGPWEHGFERYMLDDATRMDFRVYVWDERDWGQIEEALE